jgi:hypothetical protein
MGRQPVRQFVTALRERVSAARRRDRITDALLTFAGSLVNSSAASIPSLEGEERVALESALRFHGLSVLMAHHATEQRRGGAEPDDRLKGVVRHARAWAMKLAHETERTVTFLESRGVEVAAFKGPLLSLQAYGSIALRSSADIDLFVAPASVGPAVEALESIGYERAYRLHSRQLRSLVRTGAEFDLVNRRLGCAVDLHWRPAPRFYGFEWTLGDLSTAPAFLMSREVRSFVDSDLAVVLCAGAAKDGWPRIEPLLSAAIIASRGGLRATLRRGRDLGSEEVVATTLALAAALFGAELYDEESLIDGRAASVAERGLERLLSGTALPSPRRRAGDLLALHGRSLREFRLHALLLRPSIEDFRSVTLPSSLYPLYYLLRPFRLAGRAIRRRMK